MSVKLLKDLQFAEKLNSTEAITEAGKEVLNNYRAYVYTNPTSCGIVNGFIIEASKLSFDTGLKSISESVNKFISGNNISWKLASACESISNNNSTYNYINKLGVQQVEKLLEMNESDVVSYIKAGSLKNIQYIPEFRAVCKEVYKTTITEHKSLNYTLTNPISYVLMNEDESKVINVNGKAFKINENEVEECVCQDEKFNRINKLLESFKRDADNNLYVEYRGIHGDMATIKMNEDAITFTKGSTVNESFDSSNKFIDYANMVSKTMAIQEKVKFMNLATVITEMFDALPNVCILDNVKLLESSNGSLLAIVEGKNNVNVTVFHSINSGSSSTNYEYMAEALNSVLKVSGIDLKSIYEDRINEDCKKMESPEAKVIREQLEANKEAQFDVRKKKIALLAEQFKNDPVKIALLNKVAKDLAILENQK